MSVKEVLLLVFLLIGVLSISFCSEEFLRDAQSEYEALPNPHKSE